MTVRRAVIATGGATLALAAMPWVLSDFLLSLTLSCLMYAGLAVSWAMFSGATHYVSLATAAFFGLGAYVTAWGVATLPWPIVVAGGGLVAAAFAALVGSAILHLRGAYFAVLTFGLGELTRHSITYVEKSYFRTVGRLLTVTPSTTTVYLTVLAVAVTAVVVSALVRSSRFGLALSGIGADEERAQTLGVATRRVKVAGFTLSAFFAGAMGAAVAVRWTYIDPPAVFNPFIGFQTVLIAMVGGASTLGGPLVSAVVFSVFTEFLRLRFPYAYLFMLGTLLIVLVLYLPGGLASVFASHRATSAPAAGGARG